MVSKAILFDFGGTLDSNGATWLDRFYPIYQAHGIDASKETFARAFYASDDNLPSKFPLQNMDLPQTVRLQVRCVLEALEPSKIAAAEDIAETFLTDSRQTLRKARELLARLRERYRLGVVSNWYGNMGAILKGERLAELFDVVADSGVTGVKKPDPALFHIALKALGASPSEAWMVGDSIERDMRGAEGLGLRHAWLRGVRPAASACCPNGVVLSSLSDLEAALQTPDAADVLS